MSGGVESAGLVAITSYTGGTDVNITTASTTFIDLDATNLVVTFTAPASGKVLVQLTSAIDMNGATNGYWCLREDTTAIGSQLMTYSTVQLTVPTAAFYITGLTPGSSHTYKWGAKVVTGGTMRLYNGPTYGAATMKVWAAP